MKIAVSSTGKSSMDSMDRRFGRCTCFYIYDTESGAQECVENKGQSSSGGAGIAAAQQIVDENIDVLITGNLGPNAFNVLKSAEIKVMKCNEVKVEEGIELYKDGKLQELSQPGPSHQGM